MIEVSNLPALNAFLNFCATILLILGFVQIKKGRRAVHKKIMIAALAVSAMFLTSYLVYHAQAGSVPYPRYDWTRPVYFSILIPHIILAAVMSPFILLAVFHALKGRFEKHAKIVRWIWPVWIFVSISGVIIYLMLYHL